MGGSGCKFAPAVVKLREDVSEVENACGLLATIHYSGVSDTLHFNYHIHNASCVLYTEEGRQYTSIDIFEIYAAEASRFEDMLLKREIPQAIELLPYHVRVIDGILASIRRNGEYIAVAAL